MTAVIEASARPRRSTVFAVLLVLISLPAMLASVQAASFYARNRSTATMVSTGVVREYLLYVPASYDPARPTPLVISLHGGSMWPAAQRRVDQWDRVADAEGFIVVYPSGVSGRGPRAWAAGREPGLTRDVRFISDLIDTLRARYNIDSTRVYASGLSNGGGMAFALSCRLADRIAAIGVVSTAIFLPWTGCVEQRAMPVVVIQGTDDRAVPYDGGTSWVAPDVFPNIPAWTARWAVRNGCRPESVEWAIAPDVKRIEYPACTANASVILYRIEGGGHSWPGGGRLPAWFVGRTTESIDASALMWVFFHAHPLRISTTRSATPDS